MSCCPPPTRCAARVSELAATGRRVLLLGRTDAALAGQELPAGVQPISLVTLTEQVRPDAEETLNYFKDQDVRIKIISGDNPTTVAAIARRVGLELGPDAVVDARTIGEDPEELREIAERTTFSAGCRRSRSGRWCRRCSATATWWR